MEKIFHLNKRIHLPEDVRDVHPTRFMNKPILTHPPSGHLTKLSGFFTLYRMFIRPILFLLDPENVHHFVLISCQFFWGFLIFRKMTAAFFSRNLPQIPVQCGNTTFLNPLGLAAGFDKNGILLPGIETLGFGFIEIGTVTPRPQLGNPRPRLKRILEKRALLNQMGFNNDGADIISTHLRKIQKSISVPIGINISKNRDTPTSDALKDFEKLLKIFMELAQYFVVNVSSPNTPFLTHLQEVAFLSKLGEQIQHLKITQPVLIKLSPDVDVEKLKNICSLCGKNKPFLGLVLTNTIPTDLGGISGYPLKEVSLNLLKVARGFLPQDAFIISVGGIETAQDVKERLAHGANAVQVFSTLVYQGPSAPRRILLNI